MVLLFSSLSSCKRGIIIISTELLTVCVQNLALAISVLYATSSDLDIGGMHAMVMGLELKTVLVAMVDRKAVALIASMGGATRVYVLDHTILVVIDQDVADTFSAALVLRVASHFVSSVATLAVRHVLLSIANVQR